MAAFGHDGGQGRAGSYRIIARPWLWLLTRSANVRIYQDKSVREIVKEIFQAYNGDVDKGLFFRGTGAMPFGQRIVSVHELIERLLTPARVTAPELASV